MFSNIGSKQSKLAVGMAAGFLFLVLLPLFIIAHFNYPCNDDFAYAGAIYMGVKNGSDFWTIVSGCWKIAMQYYHGWQGRYFDDIISAFGVGIAIPKYYFLGTYLTLALFVVANVCFVITITYRACRLDFHVSWILAVLMTAMQILYVPYSAEAFYLYVGATGYTMAYALLLFLGVTLICFYLEKTKKRRILYGILAVLLTAMVGGSNYSTGLLTAEILSAICILMLIQKKRCRFLLLILAEYLVCFVKFNALSPGNHARMGNVKSLGIAGSILASLQRGGVFLREWFQLPVALFLVIVFLLGASQIAKMNFSFRLPGLLTALSFGMFSSMMTPPFFAGATWGPGRLINLVYFSYYFLLGGNLLYWIGWAVHRHEKCKRVFQKEIGVLPALLCFFVLLTVCLKIYGLQSTSSSSASLSLMKGEASQYLKENELRWEIYMDDSIKDAEVENFSVKPYVLYYDDIVADETDWRNYTVASFFGKNSIRIKR